MESRQLLAVFAVDTFDDVIADDGLTSLREAIQEANTMAGDDTINLPAGTYSLTLSGADEDAAATGDLDVADSTGVTSIDGEGAGTTIINAGGLGDRVLDVRPGASLVISGVTVTGGSAADGAGILNAGSLDLANCSISSNSAGNLGGGIFNNGASAVVAIDSSTIDDNAADFGGGIYNSDGQLTVTSSTINNNSAGTDGGGVDNTNGAASLANTTVSNNTAANDGGGVHNSNTGTGATTLINSTIATNAAGGDGGGVWGGTNLVVVVNTIIATNTADAIGADVSGGFTSNGNNLIGNASGSSSFVNGLNGDLVGIAIAPIDPRLGPLQDNGGLTRTHALLFDSPAIDAADNPAAPAQDQRGVGRPQAATADIGAFELSTIVVDSTADVIDAGDGVTTLREAVIAANDSSTEDRIILTGQLFTLTLAGADEDAAATGDLDITSGPVMLVGVGINQTFVNAAGLDRVFDIFATDVTFQGMTITGGSASGADAAGRGGGIRAADGALVLDEVNLVGNASSQDGAGIYKSGTGPVQVVSSIITSNLADNSGGGFYNLAGDFDVRRTTIAGNHADVDGGGFFNGVSGTASVQESTLSNNSAGGDGGGLVAENTVSIANSTLSGNAAETSGGAASVVGSLELEHVTVADNQADAGGGIFVDTGGSLSLTNTIVATNSGTTSGPDILNSGTVTSGDGNLIGNDTDLVFTPQGSDQVGTSATPLDPRLLPLADNGGPTVTHALMEDSSAIDAAVASVLAADQRGVPRRIGAASDIGALETTAVVTDVAASTDEETPIAIDLIQQEPDPRIISANLSTDEGGVWTVDQTGAAPDANVTSGDVSVADARIELNGTPLPFDSGITLATIRQNFSGAAADHRTVGAYEDENGDTRVNTTEVQSDNTPAIANLAVAVFPFQRGWMGGHVDADGTLLSGGGIGASDITQTGTGRYQITVPGVEDSYNDGMLFAIAGGDADNVTAATPLGGALWEVANRDNADDLDQGEDERFSFLYLPWATPELIAGQVLGTATSDSVVRAAGDISVTREAAGEWRLSIAGQTPETGMLILTVADDNFLSYQADADDFIIQSHDLPAATLEDSDFGFVFVPFDPTDLSLAEIDASDTLGQVTDEGDGTVTYDPSGALDSLPEGSQQPDTFTFVLEDAFGVMHEATATIDVTGLNDVPVAMDDQLSTDEDTPLVIPFATLLLNDTDADEGETDSLSIVSLDVLGTTASVRVDGDGFHYDPQGLFDELGTGDAVFETILYTIQDVHGAQSAAATITIQVNGVNDVPELSLDADGSSGAPEGDFATEYLEGGQAVAIADLDASISSADEEPVQTLTATLLDAQDADDEGLALTAEGTTIASDNGIVVSGEGTHSLLLTGPASSAVMQSLLPEIIYQNSAVDVTGSDRTIEVTVSDGEDSAQAQTTVQLVSVNDVLPDLLTFRGDRLQLLLNTGTAFERTASIYAPEWGDIQVADFTGDGRDDVMGRTATGQWQLIDPSAGSVPQVWGQWSTDTQWPTVAAADFDADGLPDIIGRNSTNQWWVSRNVGDRFETALVGQWSATHTWEDVMVADLTGDGRADVVGRTNGGWWLGESTGTRLRTSLRGNWSTGTTWSDVMIGQFQGDALPDIIGRADDGSWWVARNAGFRFETLFVGRWTSVTWSDVMTGDFNNDGVSDLVGRNDDGDWRITYITQSTFENQAWGHWSSSVTWTDVAANDFTGDGQLDLVARADDGSWWVTRNRGEGTQFELKSWTSSSNVNNWRDSVDGFFAEWES